MRRSRCPSVVGGAVAPPATAVRAPAPAPPPPPSSSSSSSLSVLSSRVEAAASAARTADLAVAALAAAAAKSLSPPHQQPQGEQQGEQSTPVVAPAVARPLHRTGFRTPLLSAASAAAAAAVHAKSSGGAVSASSVPAAAGAPAVAAAAAAAPSASTPLVFTVLWCKMSSKKHKTYEDGVLVIDGGSMMLKDGEGQTLSRSSTVGSVRNASSLGDGDRFNALGREIEIQKVVPYDQYLSGQMFVPAGGVPGAAGAAASAPRNLASALVSRLGPAAPGGRGLHGPSTLRTSAAAGAGAGSAPANGSALGAGSVRSSKPEPVYPVRDDSVVLDAPGDTPEYAGWLRARVVRVLTALSSTVVHVLCDPILSAQMRPHQHDGLRFMYKCCRAGHGCILADEMGLGKTLQALALIWTLLRQGPRGTPLVAKAMVVCPTSLVANWKRECKRWLGDERLRPIVITSGVPIAQNIALVQEFKSSRARPLLVVSYEMCRPLLDSLRDCVQIGLLVCDEGHRLKNASIKTAQMLREIPTQRRIILSGTPVQNDLGEFFTLIDFCAPGILGTPTSFRQVFELPILRGREDGAKSGERMLAVDSILCCRPTGMQSTLYQLYCRAVSESLFATSTHSMDPFVAIHALRQICSHPSAVLESEEADRLLQASCKEHEVAVPTNASSQELRTALAADLTLSAKFRVLAALVGLVHKTQPNERMVLVSNFTRTLDLVAALAASRDWPFVRLDGSTDAGKRAEAVERFNNPHANVFLFLLSSKAGGTGLNLIGGNRLVLIDPDWNPANDRQVLARVWRDGQTRSVYTYRLLTTGTIEERIFQRQLVKSDLSDTIVDDQDTRPAFSRDELRQLFRLRTTRSDTFDQLETLRRSAAAAKAKKRREADAAARQRGRGKTDAAAAELAADADGGQHMMADWSACETLEAGSPLDAVLQSLAGAGGDDVSFVFQRRYRVEARAGARSRGAATTAAAAAAAAEGPAAAADAASPDGEPEADDLTTMLLHGSSSAGDDAESIACSTSVATAPSEDDDDDDDDGDDAQASPEPVRRRGVKRAAALARDSKRRAIVASSDEEDEDGGDSDSNSDSDSDSDADANADDSIESGAIDDVHELMAE